MKSQGATHLMHALQANSTSPAPAPAGINTVHSHTRFCWQYQITFSIIINMRERAVYELALSQEPDTSLFPHCRLVVRARVLTLAFVVRGKRYAAFSFPMIIVKFPNAFSLSFRFVTNE